MSLNTSRMMPLVRDASCWTSVGGLLAAVFFWIFFQSETSDLSSRRMRSSDRSFAAVRQMTPPEPCGRTERTILRNLVRVSRDSILRLTPTLEAEGR